MENDNKLKNKNVTTYTKEMVKAIENDKSGLIKKIIHDEEEHEAEKKNISPKSKKNKSFLIISFTLVIIALAIMIFFAFFDERITTVPVQPQFSSFIFNDQTTFKSIDDLSKEKISKMLFDKANNTNVKVGGIEGVYLTKKEKVIGLKEFILSLIKGSLVFEKVNYISDNFMFGVFKSGLKSTSPNAGDLFMLMKVSSFTDVFPTMQKWERKMLYDFYGFFGVEITPETNYLFTKDFDNGIVENQNARILHDNNGNIVLMYVYADDTSVVVTNSEVAVREVIKRLNSTKIKK